MGHTKPSCPQAPRYQGIVPRNVAGPGPNPPILVHERLESEVEDLDGVEVADNDLDIEENDLEDESDDDEYIWEEIVLEELQTRVSRGGITETPTAQLPPYSGPGPGPNMRHVRQALRGSDLVDTFLLFFNDGVMYRNRFIQ